ncbi:MAG: hypothetical protein ACRCX2_05045 [Paraclostridium sp.]
MIEKEKKDDLINSIRGELAAKKEDGVEIKENDKKEVSAKALRNRARRQRKKQMSQNQGLVNEETTSILSQIDKSKEVSKPLTAKDVSKILKFKEKFTSEEVNRDFLELLEKANTTNDIAYSEMDFLEARMEHETARVVILDPSVDDIALGIGYKWFLVRPLYVNEYMEFVSEFGPRETKPKEFLEFCFKKCFLLPKMTDQQKADVPSGTMLTLYRTILDISDFNKKYRIIEV